MNLIQQIEAEEIAKAAKDGVVDDTLFSVIVAMVILTTLATPPVLAWLLGRGAGRGGGPG